MLRIATMSGIGSVLDQASDFSNHTAKLIEAKISTLLRWRANANQGNLSTLQRVGK